MAYPVKWFTSEMGGAPTLPNAPGSMIALLNACLIDGFNLQTLDSLTWDSQAGEATGTVANGHGYVRDQVIVISGANEAAYNDEHRVTWIDSTSFRFAPTTAPSGDATGAITAKAAPIGQWERTYDDGAGTKAAYRSIDPQATGIFLRVDDTGTIPGQYDYNAEVRGCIDMTDVDTWGEYFWDSENNSWWHKSHSASIQANWTLVGDGGIFYIYIAPEPEETWGHVNVFGDIDSVRPGDAFNALLVTSQEYWTDGSGFCRANRISSEGFQLARAHHQLPGGMNCGFQGSSLSTYLGYGGIPYPNDADNGLWFNRPVYVQEDSNVLRGIAPGVIQCVQQPGYPHNTILRDVAGVIGSRILCMASANTPGSESTSYLAANPMFDIVGPWR